MAEKYPEGDVFCAVCHKPLTTERDKERGYHLHCEKSDLLFHEYLTEDNRGEK